MPRFELHQDTDEPQADVSDGALPSEWPASKRLSYFLRTEWVIVAHMFVPELPTVLINQVD
jgi:hypothetical protein